MSSGKRGLSRNSKLEMEKIRCSDKFPIVLLERLIIKTDKTVSKCKEDLPQVEQKDDKQEYTNEITYKRLRNKVVSVRQNNEDITSNKHINSKPGKNHATYENKNKNLNPKVVLERISIDRMINDSYVEEDGIVSEKLDKTVNNISSRKTRKRNLELMSTDETNSNKNSLFNVNKENITTNVTNKQILTKTLSDLEKISAKQNLISNNQENSLNVTKQQLKNNIEVKGKEDIMYIEQIECCNIVNRNVLNECLPNTISNEKAQSKKDSMNRILNKNEEKTADEIKSQNSVAELDDEIIDVMTIDEENNKEKSNDSEQNNVSKNQDDVSFTAIAIASSPIETEINKDDDCVVISQKENKSEDVISINKNNEIGIIINNKNLPCVNVNSKTVTTKTNFVSEIIDSSDIISDNSSDEISTVTDDEGNTYSESISEFTPIEDNSNYSVISENPNSNFGNPVGKPYPFDKHKNLFINLKDAFESISADMNHLDEVVCTYDASYIDSESRDKYIEECYIEESLEILQVPQYIDCGSDYVVVDQSQNISTSQSHNPVSSTLEKRLNFIRGSQLLSPNQPLQSNPQSNKSTVQSCSSNDGNSQKRISIRVARCPKCKRVFTDVNFARHWDRCRIDPYIPCNYCDKKFKQKRSLVAHLNKHDDIIDRSEVLRIANISYIKAKAALAKVMKQSSHLLEIRLPRYIRVYCKICMTLFKSVPRSYRKLCDTCSKILTFHCDRCHIHSPTSSQMAMHLRSECSINTNSMQSCHDCNYVAARPLKLVQQEPLVPHIQTQLVPFPTLEEPIILPVPPSTPQMQETIFLPPLSLSPATQQSTLEKNLPQSTIENDPLESSFIYCDLCNKRFHTHGAISKHKKYCGRDAYLFCKFCSYQTKHKSAIMVHMQQHIINNDVQVINNVPCMSVRPLKVTHEPDNVSISQKEEQERIIENMIGVCCPNCKYRLPQSLKFKYTLCSQCSAAYDFECIICHMLNSSHSVLKHHVARHHAPKIFKCYTCKRRFSYEVDYIYHKNNCSLYQCSKCSYVTPIIKYLQIHQLRRHPKDEDLNYPCKRCPLRFSIESSLKQHMKHCSIEPPLQCAHCNYKSHAKYSLKRHLQSVHASEIFDIKFTCNSCAKEFINVFCFEDHIVKCSENVTT